MTITYILLALITYLIGSIPFAYIVVKRFADKNVMDYGTGNIGTMNTHRATNSKLLSLLVLIGDIAKGSAACLAAQYAISNLGLHSTTAITIAGVAVILGHNYSAYLKLKGGKGLATGVGFFLLLSPIIIAIWLTIWLIITVPTRIFVLGQIVATVLTPIAVWFVDQASFLPTLAICIPVFIKHAPRIKNIIDKTEPKMYYRVPEKND